MNTQCNVKQQDRLDQVNHQIALLSRIEHWLRLIGKVLNTEQMVKHK